MANFNDQDVRLVASVINCDCDPAAVDCEAVDILNALAAAGRLAPVGMEIRKYQDWRWRRHGTNEAQTALRADYDPQKWVRDCRDVWVGKLYGDWEEIA